MKKSNECRIENLQEYSHHQFADTYSNIQNIKKFVFNIHNKLGETSVFYALIDRKCFNFSWYENSDITTDCKIVIDSSQMLFVLIKDGKASLQKDFKHPRCIINDTIIVKNLTTGRCVGF